MTRSRDAILRGIAREEARLARIERSRDASRVRVEALRTELNTATGRAPPSPRWLPRASGSRPATPDDKVALFRTLFRGRQDVFATRFLSKRTGKAGYAPACADKFRPGICILRTGGKCGDRTNRAFVPVSDRVVLDHLQGRHVVGVYPLLEDETCWFLAFDFDGSSWSDDVAAFTEICRSLAAPITVERSRSGNGAHAWVFFSAPVPANVARRIGCYLLTETMSRRHELSMSSYDRLFPNQDTLPRGGFGNLIALPLQYEARRQGNSVFIDERGEPFADQWAFLGSVPRMEPAAVEGMAREASRTGRVIGVRFADTTAGQEEAAPWKRLPSGRLPSAPITAPPAFGGESRAYAAALHTVLGTYLVAERARSVDREVPMLLRMFEKRLRTYRAIGYARGEAPLGITEPPEERTLEYDEEALRHFQV